MHIFLAVVGFLLVVVLIAVAILLPSSFWRYPTREKDAEKTQAADKWLVNFNKQMAIGTIDALKFYIREPNETITTDARITKAWAVRNHHLSELEAERNEAAQKERRSITSRADKLTELPISKIVGDETIWYEFCNVFEQLRWIDDEIARDSFRKRSKQLGVARAEALLENAREGSAEHFHLLQSFVPHGFNVLTGVPYHFPVDYNELLVRYVRVPRAYDFEPDLSRTDTEEYRLDAASAVDVGDMVLAQYLLALCRDSKKIRDVIGQYRIDELASLVAARQRGRTFTRPT